jgi:hypothetical protein
MKTSKGVMINLRLEYLNIWGEGGPSKLRGGNYNLAFKKQIPGRYLPVSSHMSIPYIQVNGRKVSSFETQDATGF